MVATSAENHPELCAATQCAYRALPGENLLQPLGHRDNPCIIEALG